MARLIKMLFGMDEGLGPGDFVLDGDPGPPTQKMGRSPPILAHVYYDQTAVCIKVALSMEVGLGSNDIVLDGDPAPPPLKGRSSPIFGQCPL